ncbi:hypothetical protein BH10PSE10_BH10PSE10_12500 [soil metagenome]
MNCIRSLSAIALISALALSGANAAKKPATKPQEPLAQDTPLDTLKDAPKAPSLACDGPFGKDTTHAKLVAEFGAKNVAFKDVEVASNALTKASVIFDDDPTRRVVIYWKDNKARTKPAAISVEAPSTWTGPGSVRNGLTLRDMVKLNGEEFKIMGFGGIGGGEISGLKGPFADVPGGCTLKIKLEPGIANPLPPRFASVTGDQYVASKNLVLRRVRPQVSQWSVNYQ